MDIDEKKFKDDVKQLINMAFKLIDGGMEIDFSLNNSQHKLIFSVNVPFLGRHVNFTYDGCVFSKLEILREFESFMHSLFSKKDCIDAKDKNDVLFEEMKE